MPNVADDKIPSSRTGVQAPIDRLPTEIWHHIFALVENDQSSLNERLRQAPVNLLQVSQRWRQTALAVSRFWSAIEFPDVLNKDHRRALIQLAISPLSPFPDIDMHISIESASFKRAPRRDRAEFIAVLRARRERWRSLYLEPLDLSSDVSLFRTKSSNCSLPRLYEAILCGDPRRWNDPALLGMKNVLLNATELRELTLQQVILPVQLDATPNLRYLDIGRCVQDDSMGLSSINQMLSKLHKLEALRLSIRLWRGSDTFAGEGAHLPSLHTLVIPTARGDQRVTFFLRALQAPRMKHMQFGPHFWDDKSSQDSFWSDTVLEKEWTLQTLDVPSMSRVLDKVCAVFRMQRELRCVVIHAWALEILVKVAEAGELLGPALEELCIVHRGEFELSSHLLKLVKLRAGVCKLRKIRLFGSYWTDPTVGDEKQLTS